MKMLFTAILLAVTVAASPAPPAQTPETWLGMTLGEPESQVIQRYGEVGFTGFSNGSTGDITYVTYDVDHVHGTIGVTFQNGRLDAISLGSSSFDSSTPNLTDPTGLSPGATSAQVQQRRGKSDAVSDSGWHTEIYNSADGSTWNYAFVDDKLRAITWKASKKAISALPPLPPPTLRQGTSLTDALVNAAPDEESGAHNEYQYLISIRCTGNAPIPLETGQRLITDHGREYDDLSLSCGIPPANKSEIFFDVTSFFGKT